MKSFSRASLLVMLVAVFEAGLFAQGPLRGNPTPGTPQPAAPSFADRISLSGCVSRASSSAAGEKQAAVDANTPTDSRYVLTGAKRDARVPPGTGTSSLATAPVSATYRLAAIESVLSPFVGMRVQISGQVEPESSSTGDGATAKAPILRVEFVQKLASSCS